MSHSRRDFLKKAALLTGGTGMLQTLPPAIQKALAISPDPETTFYDAEHVVLLMQENRSFDHAFGSLRGVRGFNDPRAIALPDGNPVWFQPDKEGRRFTPFRMDIKNTKATWMGSIPHSWTNQIDAYNEGKYDGWIEAKRPGNKAYRHMPLTMGFYNREDLPFYYAFADAFTICDQHFCAALTGTTTNRSYFWTGKTHGNTGEKALLRNEELGYDKEASWTTFPERLEEQGISWKVYQNEINLHSLVEDESLLANFSDNNLEWFSQFGVRFNSAHYRYLKAKEKQLITELANNKQKNPPEKVAALKKELAELKDYMAKWGPEAFEKLSAKQKSLHKRAFTTNEGDPNYHKVEQLHYTENDEPRQTTVPKGDILFQFRKDVNEGTLPTVSWLVAPEKFSDHPSAPWYGAWYISEVLDILTKNPEVWKKTIFIVNYDENDGYFDHIPPFVPPNPKDNTSGKISEGLETTGEFMTLEEDLQAGFEMEESRTGPVGLGFRVPLIVASPWSRGGWVNSEVCDITSSIQFLEKFLSKKTGKPIFEPNISSWRRAVSGNLTSVFRPYAGETYALPEMLDRNTYVKQIYNASFKGIPNNYSSFTPEDIKAMQKKHEVLPLQEPGTKPSCALKYELHVDGRLNPDKKCFEIRFEAAQNLFGEESLGAAFNVYAMGNYRTLDKGFEAMKTWAFAVKSGDVLAYEWPLEHFETGQYHLQVYGPNGYFREFIGSSEVDILATFQPDTTHSETSTLRLQNRGKEPVRLALAEKTYRTSEKIIYIEASEKVDLHVSTLENKGWYDFSVSSLVKPGFFAKYAGRYESGKPSISDPFMAKHTDRG